MLKRFACELKSATLSIYTIILSISLSTLPIVLPSKARLFHVLLTYLVNLSPIYAIAPILFSQGQHDSRATSAHSFLRYLWGISPSTVDSHPSSYPIRRLVEMDFACCGRDVGSGHGCGPRLSISCLVEWMKMWCSAVWSVSCWWSGSSCWPHAEGWIHGDTSMCFGVNKLVCLIHPRSVSAPPTSTYIGYTHWVTKSQRCSSSSSSISFTGQWGFFSYTDHGRLSITFFIILPSGSRASYPNHSTTKAPIGIIRLSP